jgi:hypothetical protein
MRRIPLPSAQAGVSKRACDLQRVSDFHAWLRTNDRASGQGRQAGIQGAPAHAQTRLRLCSREQGTRHAGASSLPWPSQYPAHGAIYRDVADAVQEFLA